MVKYLHSVCLPYQGGASSVDLVCYLCLSLSYYHACSLQPYGRLLGRAGLLADVFFLLFLSLSHSVSWVRCGT